MPAKPTHNLALDLVRVTEAAALAAGRYMGRACKEDSDQAAVGRDAAGAEHHRNGRHHRHRRGRERRGADAV